MEKTVKNMDKTVFLISYRSIRKCICKYRHPNTTCTVNASRQNAKITPSKRWSEPHLKTNRFQPHRNQLIQVAHRLAKPRRHFSTAKSGANRRLQPVVKCRRNLSHQANDYRLISFDLI